MLCAIVVLYYRLLLIYLEMMIAVFGIRECCIQHVLKDVNTRSRLHSIWLYMGYCFWHILEAETYTLVLLKLLKDICFIISLINILKTVSIFWLMALHIALKYIDLTGSLHLYIIAFLHLHGKGDSMLCILPPKFMKVQQNITGHSLALYPPPMQSFYTCCKFHQGELKCLPH